MKMIASNIKFVEEELTVFNRAQKKKSNIGGRYTGNTSLKYIEKLTLRIVLCLEYYRRPFCCTYFHLGLPHLI